MIGFVSSGFPIPGLAPLVADRLGYKYVKSPFHPTNAAAVGVDSLPIFRPHTMRLPIARAEDFFEAYESEYGEGVVFSFNSLPYWAACDSVWEESKCVWIDMSILALMNHFVGHVDISKMHLDPYHGLAINCIEDSGKAFGGTDVRLYQLAIRLLLDSRMLGQDVAASALRIDQSYAVSNWHVVGHEIEAYLSVDCIELEGIDMYSHRVSPKSVSHSSLCDICSTVSEYFGGGW
jgi:hypothetical protein